MAKVTMVCGMLLTLLGLVCFVFAKQLGAADRSATALIPMFLGVPLMLLRLRDQHRYAAIEMGMNHVGEIGYLTELARPTVALVDLDLPGMSGAELLEYLNQKAPPIKTVLVTAACEERVAKLTEGAPLPYFRKPIDLNALLRTLAESPARN